MATYNGGTTDDSYTGTAAADTINGNEGNDILAGAGGGDTINGGDGSDTLYSAGVSPAWNQPYGGNPWTAPVLDTGSEVDTLNGGAGYDVIYAGYGDKVDGGADYARLLISFQGATAGVTADFSVLDSYGQLTIGGCVIKNISSVGWLEGSNFGDTLRLGWNGYDSAPIFGMGGDDKLYAGYYTSYLDGGDGNDLLDFTGSQYASLAYGRAGNDTLQGGGGYETLYGGTGDDTINGDYGFDYLYGEDGNDKIDGGSFGDYLDGGAGNDTLYGAGDADTVNGGAGTDVIYGDYSLISSAGGLSPASNDDNLFGGAGADTIHGDQAMTVSGPARSTPRRASGCRTPVPSTTVCTATTATI